MAFCSGLSHLMAPPKNDWVLRKNWRFVRAARETIGLFRAIESSRTGRPVAVQEFLADVMVQTTIAR